MDHRSFLASFKPHPLQTSAIEKLRSGLAGGIAILLLMLLIRHLPQVVHPLLIVTSMAASATLLYATPHSPLTQPWNLVGGHLVSALVGVSCGAFIPDQAVAAGVAVGTAILLMQFLNCLHPPGGATALVMAIGSTQLHDAGWLGSLYIVAINAGIMLLLALTINNLLKGRRYPVQAPVPPTPPKPAPFITLDQTDLAWALKQMDSMIDVSEEDLAEIYKLALHSAQKRIDAAMPG
ncbi:MAG: HPP family protein [Pseudomonadota bacterium]